MTGTQRICLYGGSFDPVHLGHLLVARAALEELSAERVVFIPTAKSPFKADRQPAPGTTRMQMLRLALAAKPWAAVDDIELRRGGVSYTIDTVSQYKESLPEASFCYLIGEDNIAKLHEWREADRLAKMVEFVVIPRPGTGACPDVTSGSYRAAWGQAVVQGGIEFRLRYLQGFPLGVSSSQIRQRVREGKSVEDLIPHGVGEIIRNNRLYL